MIYLEDTAEHRQQTINQPVLKNLLIVRGTILGYINTIEEVENAKQSFQSFLQLLWPAVKGGERSLHTPFYLEKAAIICDLEI